MKWLFFCLLLTGCATYKTTLTNAEGKIMICEVTGKNGIFTGVQLKQNFELCVANARAAGFQETGPRIDPSQAPKPTPSAD